MLPSAEELEAYIRANWHYLVLGIAVAYYVASKAQQAAGNVVTAKRDNSARAAVRKEALTREQSAEERIRAAREKQFAIAQEAAEKDRERAAESERQKLEEQRDKLSKRNTGEESASGHRLGSGAEVVPAPQLKPQQQVPQPQQQAREAGNEGHEEGPDGPRLKLPKLPGGERQNSTPYSGPGDDKGYRPSRYQRNCGPKGG